MARLATIDDEALARVLSLQFRGLLSVVVVADMPCRERMVALLGRNNLPVPDVLALTQAVLYRCRGRPQGRVGLEGQQRLRRAAG